MSSPWRAFHDKPSAHGPWRHRQTDRQTDTHTHTHTHTQREKKTERDRKRQRQSQRETERDRESQRESERESERERETWLSIAIAISANPAPMSRFFRCTLSTTMPPQGEMNKKAMAGMLK